ncbi:DsbA family protein [Maridesulfovibrio sp. FT414]|uniref:DsbA family protein n=1 Tax=Maridesulfovibrio sp. FT414 TaxID=2979469 RepID=UPI003D804710
MLKKSLLVVSVVFLFSGCANKQMLKDQIAQVLRENPQIVLEAMRENSLDVLTIVEQGIDAREKAKREAQFESEISNPFKPVELPGRVSLGRADAPVTIVEYTDFLCPYCSKGAKVVRKLVEDNPGKYRLLFKHLPLHERSRELAAVFEALTMIDVEQAYKFHDLAFEHQKELYKDKDGVVLGQILAQVGVDLAKLQKKLESPEVQERLLSDEREAKEFGLNATPTFIVNGVSIRGYLPADRFEKTVDLILEKSASVKTESGDGEVCEDCLNQM